MNRSSQICWNFHPKECLNNRDHTLTVKSWYTWFDRSFLLPIFHTDCHLHDTFSLSSRFINIHSPIHRHSSVLLLQLVECNWIQTIIFIINFRKSNYLISFACRWNVAVWEELKKRESLMSHFLSICNVTRKTAYLDSPSPVPQVRQSWHLQNPSLTLLSSRLQHSLNYRAFYNDLIRKSTR